MCGLSGLVDVSGAGLAPAILAMTRAVRHRGPDDEGYVLIAQGAAPLALGGDDTPADGFATGLPYGPAGRIGAQGGQWQAALGHRRLSIVDLSAAGHQPMCSPDRNLWIAYNGEVYNHVELRAELEREGIAFQTRSDTEVILAAYRRWGAGCLDRFNGMFSFLLLDCERRTLLAVRDRFGVKPLYYWIAPGGAVAFASEVKQFAELPGWRARLNGQRAYDFLSWGLFDHSDETLFEGVYQLRGGEMLELAYGGPTVPFAPGSRLPVRRWYELRGRPFEGGLPEASARYRDLLADSVRLRLRADVAVGSCLSGGLDSSTIVCLLSRLLEGKGGAAQKTFSAGASVKAYDESEYIDEVVRATGVEAHRVEPPLDGLFGALDRITRHQDEPFGSTSIYAQWHVFRLAAETGVKVMLDGQGADEQLAGYHGFFAPQLGALLRRGRWLSLYREVETLRRRHGYGRSWALQQALNNVLPEAIRQPLRRIAGRTSARPSWLNFERLGALAQDPYLQAGNAKARSVRDLSRAQILATSLPMLLHWEDRNSMAHSIEARVPFLDYRLVEFVLGLPDELKISRGVTKRVLRDAMRGILPDRVRERMDKLGFVTPEEDWMKRGDPAAFRGALRDAVAASDGVLRDEALAVLDGITAGSLRFSFLPWRLISFGAWMRQFSVRV